jgi:hypothetical protein
MKYERISSTISCGILLIGGGPTALIILDTFATVLDTFVITTDTFVATGLANNLIFIFV